MAVSQYPAAITAAYNIIKILTDSSQTDVTIGWTDNDGASNSILLIREPFGSSVEFQIQSVLQNLFNAFQKESIVINGTAVGDYPPELSGNYTIDGLSGFTVARAAIRKGELSDNDLSLLDKIFLTERPVEADGSIKIPVYSGYPSGVSIRNKSLSMYFLSFSNEYIMQAPVEPIDFSARLFLDVNCPEGTSWRLACPADSPVQLKFGLSEGVGPVEEVSYEMAWCGTEFDEGFSVEIDAYFDGYRKTYFLPLTAAPFEVSGTGTTNPPYINRDGALFEVNSGFALLWAEVDGELYDDYSDAFADGPSAYFPVSLSPDSAFRLFVTPGLSQNTTFGPANEKFLSVTEMAIRSWGGLVFTSASGLFSGLGSFSWRLGVPFSKGFSQVNDFGRCFYGCEALEELPEGLFDNCPNVTTFESCFYGCGALEELPEGLFDNCPNVTTFEGCFYGCSALEELPEGLFDNCPNVTTFGRCFYGCSALEELPEDLFDNCPDVTTFEGCFYGCSALEELPSTLFGTCLKVTNFNTCFSSCVNLSGESPVAVTSLTVSVHLYERNNYTSVFARVNNYTGCFRNCSGLLDYAAIEKAGWD